MPWMAVWDAARNGAMIVVLVVPHVFQPSRVLDPGELDRGADFFFFSTVSATSSQGAPAPESMGGAAMPGSPPFCAMAIRTPSSSGESFPKSSLLRGLNGLFGDGDSRYKIGRPNSLETGGASSIVVAVKQRRMIQ